MATDDEIRAWARGEGKPVGERGKLTNALKAEYELAHGQGNGTGSYDGSVTAGDFGDDSGPGREAEQAPRPVTRPRAPGKSLVSRVRSPRGKGGKRKRPRKQHPRIPVAGMVQRGWHELADVFERVPPMYRLMTVQAPYAGIILEDAVRDTIVDKVLQPAARTEEKSRKLSALAAPVFTAGMMINAERQEGFAFGACEKGLKYSLKQWLREAELHAEDVIEQAEEELELNANVEKLFRYIFGIPEPQPLVADGVIVSDAGAG